MRYAATIVYVSDPPAAAGFYERAFGLEQGFAAPDGSYVTLAGDGDGLSFAGLHMAPVEGQDRPAGFEVWIEAEDVAAAYSSALEAGAEPVSEPAEKPWGQTVAYVRDPSGILVEIGEPV